MPIVTGCKFENLVPLSRLRGRVREGEASTRAPTRRIASGDLPRERER